MDITFRCDHCGQSIEIDEAGVGAVVECPKCSESVLVPEQKRPNQVAATNLRRCPYCAEEIRTDAIKCRHCGEFLDGRLKQNSPAPLKAQGRKCPHCGAHGVGKVRGLQGVGEVLFAVILFFMFMLPGIIYYVYIESVPYCSSCGRRVHGYG